MTDALRFGIVGMGNAGMMHARSLLEGAIPRAALAAACDGKERLESLKGTLPGTVKLFSSYEGMLSSGACDAVIVATPHPMHPEQCMKALAAGLHVFCEKPAGVLASDVRRLNAAASGKVFTMHFNRRLEPVYQKLRSMIAAGELGRIFRVNWISTAWFRSESYYASAAWRGTWKGEGGGVLINQCVHDLDAWQHLFGMPERIRAFCRFGKHHDIEVEDEVTAFMEYKDGQTGVLIASSGESPGTNRIEIACARGKLVVEGKAIRFFRTVVPTDKFCKENPKVFGEPEHWLCEIPTVGQADLSGGVLRNFVDAALDGVPLLIDGHEGLASLELENAILLSSWIDDWASVPVDAKLFDAEFKKRVARSKSKKSSGKMKFADLRDSFK